MTMCGIFCALGGEECTWPSANLERLLQHRGPDSCRKECVTVCNAASRPNRRVELTFCSTVLSLRGGSIVPQPLHGDGTESSLCWNGEAWTIAGQSNHGNDTEAVSRMLEGVTLELLKTNSRAEEFQQRAHLMAKTMSQVAGPYAFVFYDARNQLLFYGRDFLGRRSLLTRGTSDGLTICSVANAEHQTGWLEVEADGLYIVDLQQTAGSTSTAMLTPYWSQDAVTKVPYRYIGDKPGGDTDSVIPRLSLNKSLLPQCPVLGLDAPGVLRLEGLLRQSLALRILGIQEPLGARQKDTRTCSPRLAVLFSGGLDCTVLARLAHDIYPLDEGIDLLNVAFENPRIHKAPASAAYELCPDRITGRASYAELQRVCPNRTWKFIAINVPYSETLEHRRCVISLMHPHNTEMDLSISYALYFAARGEGFVSPSSTGTQTPYRTFARVLLSGLGADELFGGYQRHATAFNRNGFPGLLDELDLDISRLGKRNLGRDDRVISNWGREARFPFLDEQLLAWALAAPVTEKCGFGELAINGEEAGDGSELLEPGKKVLRCLAWRLGMQEVAKEKKRAIQFGARTAKMETGKTKGTQLLS